jgi:hypothetical protein
VIPVDLVQDVLRLPYRERFSLILAELGTGLAGRPDDLAEALTRAHPGLRETSKTLRILGDQRKVLEDFATNSNTVVAELARNKANVTRFVREAGDAAEISASERDELEAGFAALPGFLEQLGPYMSSLGRVADEQIALLPDVRRASGDLNRFFEELGPFSDGARPALRALADASDKGIDALDASRDSVHQLAEASKDAPATAKPLRQFLISLDDRKRAPDPDARAARTAPPAPDPTHKHLKRGFTGIEGFLNYAYWQTLAINGFDEVSHFLRIYGVIDQCSNFNNDPTRELLERCNSFFGPFQPGIKNATGEINGHDFGKAETGNYSDHGGRKANRVNDGSKRATSSSDDADPAAAKPAGGAADEGAVDAAAAPEPDGPQPQQLVPDVRDLVDNITDGIVPDQQSEPAPAPESGSDDGTRLLDFLLGP